MDLVDSDVSDEEEEDSLSIGSGLKPNGTFSLNT